MATARRRKPPAIDAFASPAKEQASLGAFVSPLASCLRSDPLAADFLVCAFAAASLRASAGSGGKLVDCGWPGGGAEARLLLERCPPLPYVLCWYTNLCGTPEAAGGTGVQASLRESLESKLDDKEEETRSLLRYVLCDPRLNLITASRAEVEQFTATLDVQPTIAFRVVSAPSRSACGSRRFAALPFSAVHEALREGVPADSLRNDLASAFRDARGGPVAPEWARKSGLLKVLYEPLDHASASAAASPSRDDSVIRCVLVCRTLQADDVSEGPRCGVACDYVLVWPDAASDVQVQSWRFAQMSVAGLTLALLFLTLSMWSASYIPVMRLETLTLR
eukprot:TRINITY_DN24296_c0_g2_i1.p1 TRINITY_DN24296_c0_g2~~TRINITY_DN24296_c0_g2_i1.p1  ORF type:complete len:336 (-),score=58.71 TRINITY_DN24296_c0_g2_i1:22-1029(-)